MTERGVYSDFNTGELRMVKAVENGHLGEGIYVSGELLGHGAGKEFKDRKGETHQEYGVRVLVGEQVIKVSYRGQTEAETALGHGMRQGGENGGGRDWVVLQVRPRAQAFDGRSALFYSGVTA
jgi:hypothetical protein